MALKNKLALIVIIAALGIWLSVVTLSGVGLAAVPIILVLLFDQGVPFARTIPYKFSVSRRVTQRRVVTGERVLVELTVTNEGKDAERLVLEDQAPSGVTITRGTTRLVCALRRGARATLRYEVSLLEPGDVHFGECLVKAQSLFGLTEQRFEMVAPRVDQDIPEAVLQEGADEQGEGAELCGNVPV